MNFFGGSLAAFCRDTVAVSIKSVNFDCPDDRSLLEAELQGVRSVDTNWEYTEKFDALWEEMAGM